VVSSKCFTTNLRSRDLDPALIRPGRCLANLEFDRFGVDEARAALRGTGFPVNSPMTLAGLYEAKRAVTQVRTEDRPAALGAYL
jgi:hypothetical protein